MSTLLAALVVSGCRTALDPGTGGGVDPGGPVVVLDLSVPRDFAFISPPARDLAGPFDLAAPDERDLGDAAPDLAAAPTDLAAPLDLPAAPDLAAARDLTSPPDLVTPPDLLAPTCRDGRKNGLETDIDCGGGLCAGCGGGRACVAGRDCQSGACVAGTCRASLSFAAPAVTDVAGVPQSLAADDFNGDGRADLAAAMFDTGFVGVLLNQGAGRFDRQAVVYSSSMASQLVGVVSGAFDLDGRRDVAVIGAGAVVQLYGVGDGSFTAPTNARPGAAVVTGLASADLDGDRLDDLVLLDARNAIAGGATGTVISALSAANRQPARLVLSKSVGNPAGAALGDLDGDGRLDVVVTSSAWPGQYQALRGDGKGGFVGGWSGMSGIIPVGVALGDWNGDGRSDLAGAQSNTDEVGAWLGSGAATFNTPRNVATARAPLWLVSADFDLDRRPDLAVSCGSGAQNTVEVLLGNGDGTFTSSLRVAAGSGPGAIVAFDANADGRPDLAVTDGNGQRVVVLLNTSP